MKTLEGKFKKWLDTNPRKELRDIQCKVIAEDFAIGFAEWFDSIESKELIEDLILVGELSSNLDKKQLLEIYKKEKGL